MAGGLSVRLLFRTKYEAIPGCKLVPNAVEQAYVYWQLFLVCCPFLLESGNFARLLFNFCESLLSDRQIFSHVDLFEVAIFWVALVVEICSGQHVCYVHVLSSFVPDFETVFLKMRHHAL